MPSLGHLRRLLADSCGGKGTALSLVLRLPGAERAPHVAVFRPRWWSPRGAAPWPWACRASWVRSWRGRFFVCSPGCVVVLRARVGMGAALSSLLFSAGAGVGPACAPHGRTCGSCARPGVPAAGVRDLGGVFLIGFRIGFCPFGRSGRGVWSMVDSAPARGGLVEWRPTRQTHRTS